MEALLQSLLDLIVAVWSIFTALFNLALPWIPLFGWIAFWLCAVNWTKLRSVLLQGGWTGFVLIALVAILCWGVIAPPAEGSHHLFGLTLSNFVGKTVYVTTLACIALLCGSVQLSGACGGWCCFGAEEDEAPSGHH